MTQLLLTKEQPRRISRDEMNLAEFPLTVLSTRSNPKTKTLEFTDTIKGKSGEPIKREWVVTGADKFGLPTSSDDEVLLGLLQLTVADQFRSPKIYFTRYELLKVLRWSTEGRSYTRLQNALDRLSGVRIKATNAFYDNETKGYSTRNFGIIDDYEINDGRAAEHRPSFFRWSEVLFQSYQVGFIKRFDLDFFLTLKSAVSKRLYRYLDKHFWYHKQIKRNLFTLAHEKIGVSRNYKYVSSIRQQLDPAFEELIETGWLSKVEFVGKGKNAEVIMYSGTGKPRCKGDNDLPVVEEISGVTTEGRRDLEIEERLVKALSARGIKATQARKLIENLESQDYKRVVQIIRHVDTLTAGGSSVKNPAGFLYRAIEKPGEFVLPSDNNGGIKNSPAQRSFNFNQDNSEADREDALTARYWREREAEYNRIRRDEVEPSLIEKTRQEAITSLESIRGALSRERFEKTVEDKVTDDLLNLFGFPCYEEWKKTESRHTH